MKLQLATHVFREYFLFVTSRNSMSIKDRIKINSSKRSWTQIHIFNQEEQATAYFFGVIKRKYCQNRYCVANFNLMYFLKRSHCSPNCHTLSIWYYNQKQVFTCAQCDCVFFYLFYSITSEEGSYFSQGMRFSAGAVHPAPGWPAAGWARRSVGPEVPAAPG